MSNVKKSIAKKKTIPRKKLAERPVQSLEYTPNMFNNFAPILKVKDTKGNSITKGKNKEWNRELSMGVIRERIRNGKIGSWYFRNLKNSLKIKQVRKK